MDFFRRCRTGFNVGSYKLMVEVIKKQEARRNSSFEPREMRKVKRRNNTVADCDTHPNFSLLSSQKALLPLLLSFSPEVVPEKESDTDSDSVFEPSWCFTSDNLLIEINDFRAIASPLENFAPLFCLTRARLPRDSEIFLYLRFQVIWKIIDKRNNSS